MAKQPKRKSLRKPKQLTEADERVLSAREELEGLSMVTQDSFLLAAAREKLNRAIKDKDREEELDV